MKIHHALRLGESSALLPRLALTGAGGKSEALFQTASQLFETGLYDRVLVTASTHLGTSQLSRASSHLKVAGLQDLQHLAAHLPVGVVAITGPPAAGDPGRTSGLNGETLDRLFILAERLHAPLLVEADGSRRLPVKAPADHEPAIPAWVNRVVVVAGLSALGRPLDKNWVHRPDRFAALSGLAKGSPLNQEALRRVLCHPEGGLKGIPAQAQRVALLNQADDERRRTLGTSLAQTLLACYDAVLVARLHPESPELAGVLETHEPAGGVILAAGGSHRLGQPKQLLEWGGEPYVRRTARLALKAGLDPVIVVTGAYARNVREALDGLPVLLAHNPGWEQGQGSSVSAGVRSLPERCGSALFLLSDQPQVPSLLLQELVRRHALTLADAVAPRVGKRRANPVLFDRRTFPGLAGLSGDAGGRALFDRLEIDWLDWPDAYLLLDVDTPADLQHMQELERRLAEQEE